MPEADIARSRRDAGPQEAEQSLTSKIMTGAILLAVMLGLFMLAGFQG
jgi:hypothetical protein